MKLIAYLFISILHLIAAVNILLASIMVFPLVLAAAFCGIFSTNFLGFNSIQFSMLGFGCLFLASTWKYLAPVLRKQSDKMDAYLKSI